MYSKTGIACGVSTLLSLATYGLGFTSEGGMTAYDNFWAQVETAEGMEDVFKIDLASPNGFRVSLLSRGAVIHSVNTADSSGAIEEITLNLPTMEQLLMDYNVYGSTLGRVANRVGDANFTIEGETFTIDANDNGNSLHGGQYGLDKVLWDHQVVAEDDRVGVQFTYDSPDGEGGFPGRMIIKATYSITGGEVPGTGKLYTDLCAEYIPSEAGEDGPSVVNLSNHAYWNLSGHNKRTIVDQTLEMPCDRYLPTSDDEKIPTGEIASVDGTAFDFREPRVLGEAIQEAGGLFVTGVDQYIILEGTTDDGEAENGELKLLATLRDEVSGRVMTLETTQPGVQCYTSNWLPIPDNTTDPSFRNIQWGAVALEHMHFPDAINNEQWAGSVLIQPGETRCEHAVHTFSAV